ncbi:hypothetical protein FRC07_001871 [Ceratobasidium sp. 392]|nr:hypothetical protein FRC07_001871 [Ceratobasidium sp. 392]
MHIIHTTTLLLFYSFCVSAFTNPLKTWDGSDPYMVYSNGYYYLTSTTWTNIQITRGKSMAELKTATPKVVWSDTTADRCCGVWAPEIHWMAAQSSWYIYYTAGNAANYDGQRLHVLKGSSSDIWAATWSYAGKLTVPNRADVWSIDATVMFLASGQYLVYSSFDGADQCLWIAKMNSPTSLGNAYKISTPTNAWERIGAPVNEGPAGLYHGGRTWIVYSASSCGGNGYSLATLELTGSDPLSAASWKKNNAGPVFSAANGNNATGHNGFFTA